MNLQRTIMNHYNNALNKPQETNALRGGVFMLSKYIANKAKQNPNLSAEELKDFIFEENRKFAFEYVSMADTRIKVYQVDAMEYLLNNPGVFNSEYEKVKGTTYETETIEPYSSIFLQSAHSSMVQCYSLIQTLKRTIEEDKKLQQLVDYCMQSVSNEKSVRAKMNPSDFEEIKLYISMCKGDEKTQIAACMKFFKEKLERELKESLISSLQLAGGFLDKHGFLNNIQRRYNNFLHNIFGEKTERELKESLRKSSKSAKGPANISEEELAKARVEEARKRKERINTTSYGMEARTGSNGKIGIKDAFNPEYLQTLDINTLVLFSIFWQNELSKKVQDVDRALFIIDELNLWQSAMERKRIDISNEDIDGLYTKLKTLSTISRMIFTASDDKERVRVTKDDAKYDRIDLTDSVTKFLRSYGQEYKTNFDSMLPGCDNDLEGDLDTYIPMANAIDNVYYIKDSNIIAMMTTILKNKKIRNWGYVPETRITKDGPKNSIQSNSNMILMAIDCEGFNVRLAFHVEQPSFLSFWKNNQNTTIIPMYQGYEDFKNYSTPLFMPITKEMGAVFRKELSEMPADDARRNLYSHLVFLADNSRFPEHLKETDEKRKKTKSSTLC